MDDAVKAAASLHDFGPAQHSASLEPLSPPSLTAVISDLPTPSTDTIQQFEPRRPVQDMTIISSH